MPESFKCPTCAAPLTATGEALVNCTYCGGSIVAPESTVNAKSGFDDEKKAKLEAVLGAVLKHEAMHQPGIVIDLRGGNQFKSVIQEMRVGHNTEAASMMTTSFGFRSNDAQQIVDAISNGQPIDLEKLHAQQLAHSSQVASKWLRWTMIIVVVTTVLPILVALVVVVIVVLIPILIAIVNGGV